MRSPSKANVSTHPARGASFGMCPVARVPPAVSSGADQATCRYVSRVGCRAIRSNTLSIPERLTLRAMNAGDSVSTARRTLSSLRVSASSSFCVRSSLAFIRSPHPNEIDRPHKMELYSILWRAVEAGPRIHFSNRRGQKPLFTMRERAMASAIESDELTRVGPGTVMGDLMRQYWIPAAKSSELKAGGEPIKLMLLGEKLIAFRDETTGRVGVMDQRCPHRC